MLPHLGGGDRYEVGGAVLTTVDTYEAATSTMVNEMTLELGDRRDHRLARHRVMTCREIVEMLEGAGFEVTEIAGGLDAEPFEVGAGRCLITSLRP